MKNERMPKLEYFKMRYSQALENGNDQKADYYKGRIEQLEGGEKESLFVQSESKDTHFFIQTLDTWVTGTDLNECLSRLKDNTNFKSCNVYKVLLSEETIYDIKYYIPQVDANKLIFVGEFKLTKLRK
jgi:hypothetical protein